MASDRRRRRHAAASAEIAELRRRRRRSMFTPGAWVTLIFVGLVAAAVAVAWFAAGLAPLSR